MATSPLVAAHQLCAISTLIPDLSLGRQLIPRSTVDSVLDVKKAIGIVGSPGSVLLGTSSLNSDDCIAAQNQQHLRSSSDDVFDRTTPPHARDCPRSVFNMRGVASERYVRH